MSTVTYASEEEYRDYLGLPDALSNAQLAELLDASRTWDLLCSVEPGWFAVASSTARSFSPERAGSLWLGALATDVGVVVKIDVDGDRTFETTLSAALDYYLEPVSGPPYHRLVIDPANSRYSLPIGPRRVQVTAYHGWSQAAPEPVRRATMMIAKRYNVRPNTPEGIKAGGEHMMRLAGDDPDVKAILRAGGYRQGAVIA